MKKSTKIIFLVSVALISLGLILTVGGLASGVQIERILQSGLWDTVLYEGSAENDFSSDGRYQVSPADIQELLISWTNGKITVEPYDGAEILIEESSSGKIHEKNHLGYTTADGVLQIFDYPAQIAVNFSFHQPAPPKDLRIYLPAAFAQELESLYLDTFGTQLDLHGLHVGTLSISTVDGDLSMQDSTMDALDIDAANANLLLQGSQVHTLTVDNLDGDMTVKSSTVDELDISTMGGNLYGSFLHCPKTVHFNSLSGSAELRLPPDSQFTAKWDSASGTYDSNFQGSHGNHTHTVGDGSSQISIDTMSGALHILSTDSPA